MQPSRPPALSLRIFLLCGTDHATAHGASPGTHGRAADDRADDRALPVPLLSRRVRIPYARLTPRPIPRDRAHTPDSERPRDLERKKFSQASGAADALDKANKEIATLKERIREFKELVKGCTEIVRLRRAKSGGLTTEQFTFSKRSRDGTVINEDGEAEAGRGGAGVSAAASDGMGMPVDEGTPVDEGLEKDEESEGEEALKEQLRSAHEQIAMLKAMVAKLEAEKEELAIAAALASYVSDAIELPNADEVAAGFDSVTSDNAQSAAVASDSESPSPELARVRAEAEGGQFVNGEVIHPASGALTRGEHAASREQQQQTPHVQQQQTQQQAGSQALQSAATVEEPLTGINPETGAYYSRVLSSVEESEALANLAAFFTDGMKEENRREKNGHSCVVVDKKLLYPISGEYDKTLEPIDKEAQEMSTVCIDSQSIRHCMGRVPGLKTVVNACVKEASRTTGVKLKEYDAHVLLQGVELNNASVWDKHRDVQDGEKAAEAWKKKQDYEPSSEQEEYQQLKASTLHHRPAAQRHGPAGQLHADHRLQGADPLRLPQGRHFYLPIALRAQVTPRRGGHGYGAQALHFLPRGGRLTERRRAAACRGAAGAPRAP